MNKINIIKPTAKLLTELSISIQSSKSLRFCYISEGAEISYVIFDVDTREVITESKHARIPIIDTYKYVIDTYQSLNGGSSITERINQSFEILRVAKQKNAQYYRDYVNEIDKVHKTIK